MKPNTVYTGFIIFFLLFPLIVLIGISGHVELPSAHEWIPALKLTVLQAAASAFGSVVFGWLGAVGILALTQKWQRRIKIIILIPSFIPPLFVALSFLNLLKPFPFGLAGIVLIHSAMNCGLVAVYLSRAFQNQLHNQLEHALVDGAQFASFWRFAGLKEYRELLWQNFIFVFAICFSSFVIPLIVGGGANYSFEVLMYQHFRFDPNLNVTLGYAIIQFFIFAVFLLFRFKSFDSAREKTNHVSPYLQQLGKRIFIFPPLLLSVLCILGLGFGWSESFAQFRQLTQLQVELPFQILTTASLAILVGSGTFLLLLVTLMFSPSRKRDNFLNVLHGPGPVLWGIVLVVIAHLMQIQFFMGRLILIAAATVAIVFSFLFRLRWKSVIEKLSKQILVAESLGATRFQIATEITWPQAWSAACDLAGLAGFWATGEFAVSTFLLSSDASLSLAARGLMGAYRLELAMTYVVLSVLVGFVIWLFFKGFRNVIRA